MLGGCAGSTSTYVTPIYPNVRTEPSGQELSFEYPGSACAALDHVQIFESANTINLYVFERGPSNGACSAVGKARTVVVKLRTSVNGRNIAACFPPVRKPCDPPPPGGYTALIVSVK